MKSLLLLGAATAAAALAWGAPANAATVPESPVTIYLKDHEDFPLDGRGDRLELTADPDLWSLRPVEALLDLGTYQVVHLESGRCLSADTSGGGESAPVALADCGDAIAWDLVYDDRTDHYDYRFITPDGYYLGVENGVDVAQGTSVEVVKVDGTTRHFQEWRLTAYPDGTPSSPPPDGTPSSEAPPGSSESPSGQEAAAQLPRTGAAAGAAAGAGAVALAGGAALVVWWQRRRALRSVW